MGLIPAAGRGTRLAPLPFSKELVPVGFQHASEGADRKPKPVSQYLLERMRLAGAQQVFFITRPGKGDIADYYGDGSRLGMDFAYLQARLPWGPPFSLSQAVPFIGDADVVFGFPDILIDPVDSFTPLLARQAETGADVVLGLFDATSALLRHGTARTARACRKSVSLEPASWLRSEEMTRGARSVSRCSAPRRKSGTPTSSR